jgi:SAM-dependent methyltransferase
MQTHELDSDPGYTRDPLPIDVSRHALSSSELAVLARYRDDFASKHVLDIGCGSARLAPHLLALTPDYLGIDASPVKLASCRAQYPAAQFLAADMRSLGAIYGTIDTAIASANVFDVLSHDARLQLLTELHRVLVPGGLLVFSSHNRTWTECGARPHLQRADGVIDQLRRVGQFFVASVNHLRLSPLERSTDQYALLDDSDDNYSVLHYYIDREMQTRQLTEAGFALVETIDTEGAPLQPGCPDVHSPSLLYVARR